MNAMKMKSISQKLAYAASLIAIVVLVLTPKTTLAASILCGQTVTNTTTSPSQIDQYTFSGNAGQVISVSLYSSLDGASNSKMVADIYDPNGNLVTTASAGSQGFSDAGGGATNLTLAVGGTYTILVHDVNNTQTAKYALSLQTVNNGGCESKVIECGQTVMTNTSFNSEMDAYTFSGSAGQMISVSLYSSLDGSSNSKMVADIYDPNGNLLTTASAGSQGFSDAGGGGTNLTLAVGGIYTILVHDVAYCQTAQYALSLQTVNGGGCNSPTLSCGQNENGQISLQSQMNSYELVATAGEHVLLSDSGFSGMVLDVYDASGSNIFSMGQSTSENYTFGATGIYTVMAHSRNYIGTGLYNISLTVFGGCVDLPNVFVTPTNLSVYPGNSATFTATADGPGPLYYQWLFNSSEIMGATNFTYNIAGVQSNNLGTYAVVVSNPGGSVTSAPPDTLSFSPLQLVMKNFGPSMVLIWPTNAIGFTLQMTTNLAPPIAWRNVPGTPVISGGQNEVTNSISGQQFFRLSQQ